MSRAEEKNNKRPGEPRPSEGLGEDEAHPTASFDGTAGVAGGQVGAYKLLRILGEGGFAVVYLAEQQRPVKRRVALKVIKPGMDSKQVIARFEAERQALVLLDHPNIAQVYDAGTTEAGRPYFVMEYVRGISITEHCDGEKLSIEERLELFLQVCEAVQHAHQKGIIHRDIKPSNVLVSIEGEKGLPKIIDFGVAKAITQPLTERTLFTEQGQMIGTPEYMSPEQAGMTAQDIDTRSDIYSLGVVLYELLAGALPFDRKTLERKGFAEIQRIIREEDPPRPSTKLSDLGEEATKIAKSRRTEVATLAKRLHRELEWIPLKAMRKERTHRYRSASEFADDIQNYLSGAPLIAGPESAVYRMKKFVRRKRALVTGIAAVAAAIVVGFIVSTAMYFRAEALRVKAEQALKKETIARAEAEHAEELLRYFLAKQAREKEAAVRAEPVAARAEDEQAEELVRKAVEEEAKVLAFDDFDGKLSLDWEILNPDPSHYSLTKKPGSLTITTQQGGFALFSKDYKNVFLIDCPAGMGEDFQITTCISSFKLMDNWNQAGLICWNDDDNYLKFVYEWASIWESPSLFSGRMFTVMVETEGDFETVRFPLDEQLEKLWLRVTKRGNRYTFSTSFDGKTFLPRKSPIWDGTDLFKDDLPWGDGSVKRVGIFAKNGLSSQAPEIDASFDFFEVRALPAPEEAPEAKVLVPGIKKGEPNKAEEWRAKLLGKEGKEEQ